MAEAIEGLEQIKSLHSVDETVKRLRQLLDEKGIKVFALVDHSGEAETAGLTLRPTKVLIFGAPRAGTPLMAAALSAAIDLPLKALVWQDAAGQTWIAWNTPEYLQRRHGFPAELMQNIAGVAGLLRKAAESQ
jgi:uncharacterized protein (DUF302 family)